MRAIAHQQVHGRAAEAILGRMLACFPEAGFPPPGAILERLLPLRGVGRWTVEMLLIFTLGRPDVLPVDDFAVREGFRKLKGMAAQPAPKALAVLGLPWAPHRSTAAWYLWRASEEGRNVKSSAVTA